MTKNGKMEEVKPARTVSYASALLAPTSCSVLFCLLVTFVILSAAFYIPSLFLATPGIHCPCTTLNKILLVAH